MAPLSVLLIIPTPSLSFIYAHPYTIHKDDAHGPGTIPGNAAGVGAANNSGISAVDRVQ